MHRSTWRCRTRSGAGAPFVPGDRGGARLGPGQDRPGVRPPHPLQHHQGGRGHKLVGNSSRRRRSTISMTWGRHMPPGLAGKGHVNARHAHRPLGSPDHYLWRVRGPPTGIGATKMASVWATGELWLKVPQTMRLRLKGPARGGGAKDVILRSDRPAQSGWRRLHVGGVNRTGGGDGMSDLRSDGPLQHEMEMRQTTGLSSRTRRP